MDQLTIQTIIESFIVNTRDFKIYVSKCPNFYKPHALPVDLCEVSWGHGSEFAREVASSAKRNMKHAAFSIF